jgi:hypothetical protein
MVSSNDNQSKEEILYLKSQLEWCLNQYENETEGSVQIAQSFLPDWSAFRTLQNHLNGILNDAIAENPVAIASLIVNVLNRVFLDFCSDTPWDKDQLINNARRSIHNLLLDLLKKIYSILKNDFEHGGGLLWRAYCEFEFEYNKLLCDLNDEDQIAINAMIEKIK